MGDCVFVWSMFNGGLYLYGVCLMGDCICMECV